METLDSFANAYPLSILIADEHLSGQATTCELLSGLGYRPEIAGSAEDLVRMAGNHQYDVILAKISMPGLDLLLSNPRPGYDVRPLIIAIAGSARLDFKQVCRQARVDHCITGPVETDDFLLQLKACSVLAGKCRVHFQS